MLKALPVKVKPVEAVYVPAPLNCVQVTGVVPKVPPASTVQTQPVSACVEPVWMNVNAETNSAHVLASVERDQPLALAM